MREKRPIALVIPWFGKQLKGGAEQQAWQLSTRLAAAGETVEVLTTCCSAFSENWSHNHLPAGITHEDGMTIRRFKVDKRNAHLFDDLNQKLLAVPHEHLKPGVPVVPDHLASVFAGENINSADLLRFIQQEEGAYRGFIFMPYLYGTALNGVPLVRDKAWLLPCLHDEAYAYLPPVEHIFRIARGLFFNSVGEYVLAQRLFGPGICPKSRVMGEGVEINDPGVGEAPALPEPLQKNDRFILCAGRRDPTKNTDFLVNCFKRFRTEHKMSDLKLVLIGPGNTAYDSVAHGIVDLGLVSESEKISLMHGCQLLVNPSTHESFSRVIMEAWQVNKPVAVHGKCLATACAVEAAGGGYIATSAGQWVRLFETVATCPKRVLTDKGQKGKSYAAQNSDWDRVILAYQDALKPESAAANPRPTGSGNFLENIHQILPSISYGDAVSNHAFTIRDRLRGMGFGSDIYTRYVDARNADQVRIVTHHQVPRQDALLYHHSIGTEIADIVRNHKGPKCLIYHNITPASFFEPYDAERAELLENGRRELAGLSQTIPLAAGVSRFNCRELVGFGFKEPLGLSLFIHPGFWNFSVDPPTMQALQDGRTNIISVSRLSPNKRQDQMIEIFYCFKKLVPDARLFLIGGFDPHDAYYQKIRTLIETCQLNKSVFITGKIAYPVLHAFYRCAHLFWSMSEHEGFGVPLIEAMWFDVPVLAYKSSAVPETLGDAGFMITDKTNPLAIAALSKKMIMDRRLNKTIIAAQQKRREEVSATEISQSLATLVEKLERRP